MVKALAMMEKLMAREDRVSLLAMENVLKFAIPFNAPHGFRLRRLGQEEVRIELPNSKLNHNHVGGIHACAIATLGEFCAGLTLARHLGFTRYRFILAELSITYHRQGRSRLTGVARVTLEQIAQVQADLVQQEKLLFPHTTLITDEAGETVAEVRSVWQIKNWDKVRLR